MSRMVCSCGWYTDEAWYPWQPCPECKKLGLCNPNFDVVDAAYWDGLDVFVDLSMNWRPDLTIEEDEHTEWLGYTREEFMAKKFSELREKMSLEQQKRVIEYTNRLLKGEGGAGIDWCCGEGPYTHHVIEGLTSSDAHRVIICCKNCGYVRREVPKER